MISAVKMFESRLRSSSYPVDECAASVSKVDILAVSLINQPSKESSDNLHRSSLSVSEFPAKSFSNYLNIQKPI